MSWSFSAIGKPAAIAKALDEESAKQSGQCKVEFDAALPHLKALVQENFNNNPAPSNFELLLEIEANGSGTTDGKTEINRSCNVRISSSWKRLLVCLMLSALLALTGCDKKLDSTQAALLNQAAAAAKERAASGSVVMPQLKMKDSSKQDAYLAFAKSHISGLNSDSAAFQSWQASVALAGSLGQASVLQLKEEADTAAARAGNFRAYAGWLDLSDANQNAWIQAHQAALDNLAVTLKNLAASYAPAAGK